MRSLAGSDGPASHPIPLSLQCCCTLTPVSAIVKHRPNARRVRYHSLRALSAPTRNAAPSAHALCAGADRLSAPGPCRQRGLGLGNRPGARWPGPAPHRGPRSPALPRGIRARAAGRPGVARPGARPGASRGISVRRERLAAERARGGLRRASWLRLAGAGLTYACDCSRRRMQRGDGGRVPNVETRYDGRCRDPRASLLVRVPESGYAWIPAWSGSRTFGSAPRRRIPRNSAAISWSVTASGQWTYQFAVTVDDWLEEVDLVVRGEDLLEFHRSPAAAGRSPRADRADPVPPSSPDPRPPRAPS